jgi:hypothetical protein
MAEFTDTFDRSGSGAVWGRMEMPEGGFVRWVNPTYAGTYGASSATCNVCGNVTTIRQGETIAHGDPRLCEHMGGPPAVRVGEQGEQQ